MTTGRYTSDLTEGDELGPVEYAMSRFIAREYAHANELHQPCFQGVDTQIAPATLVHIDKLRLYKIDCPGGAGPSARIHYEFDATMHEPVLAGTRIVSRGKVVNRYEKKGREYVVTDIEMRAAADGRLLISYRDTVILSFKAAGRATGEAERPQPVPRAAAPRDAVVAPPSGSDTQRVDSQPALEKGSEGARLTFATGYEFRTPPRPMTRERMRWYVDIQETVQADTGRIVTQPPTIHDDDAYAKKNGLPGIIADGMISTNWILGLLVDVFGPEAAGNGRLRTKYIAPVYEDQVIVACARVRGSLRDAQGRTVYELDVWCEDDKGLKVTVGEAVVRSTQR